MKILYVEDNFQDADLTRRILERSAPQMQMDLAQSLDQARRHFMQTDDYDLVLLDLRLPDGSGLELLSEIQAQAIPVVVVILTGSGDEETAVAALKAGAHDYLVKRGNYLERLPDVIETAVTRYHDEAVRRTHPLRVLYVEHHSADIDLTRRHLARYAPHIQLEVLHSIEKTLQRLPTTPDETCPCDVLLLDYRLPGLNALDALKILHDERRLDLPIVMVTGQGNEEIATQALRLGASDYLVKHARYLFELPAALENAYHRAQSARRQAALFESEARFRRLAENARDVIFRVSLLPEVKIEYISPAVTALTGYAPEDFYANQGIVAELINMDADRSQLTALSSGQADSKALVTIRLTHRDGRLVWVEINPVFLRDEAGRAIALEGIARDITASKEAEETLRLQSSALEAAANGIVITDIDGNIEWVNPAFVNLSGYTAAELLGQNPRLLKSDMHDELFYAQLWNTILAGDLWRGEIINKRKNGELYTEETAITPLKDAAGQISHFIAIKHDVTAQKEAEADRGRLLAQVRQQAQQVQQIIETVPEGVLLLDSDGRVIQANPVAERDIAFLTQSDDDDVITTLGDRLLPDLLAAPQTGFWHEIEYNGRTFEAIARPVGAIAGDAPPERWVMVLNDVTDARAHLRYQQAQERLAMVGQLAAGIAHDFNNVMGVISLYAELLQKTSELSAKGQKQLVMIYNQARHASKLIEQILDFSRRSIMELATLDLLPLVKELFKLLERTMPGNIKLSLDYHEKGYIVKADPTRLQQVFMNLAVNARDAMPDGGQLTIALSTLILSPEQSPPLPDMSSGEWVQVSVSDTGAGISEENRTRLFEPFFTTKEPGKGTGLGLAQVHGIIKQHGGSLDVQSQLGVGSTFTFFLPLLPLAETKTIPESESVLPVGGTETILLVEDNQDMLSSVSEALMSLGYRVLTATNGMEAVGILAQKETAVSLVLSDLIMPEMGGLELYEHMRKAYPQTRMIMMTGHPLGKEAKGWEEYSAVGWIQKPFVVDELAARVRAALDGVV